jgi:hypothetical protein
MCARAGLWEPRAGNCPGPPGQAMRAILLSLALAALTVSLSGCATSFHAGGRKVGMDAGAAVGSPPAPVVHEPPFGTPPPTR